MTSTHLRENHTVRVHIQVQVTHTVVNTAYKNNIIHILTHTGVNTEPIAVIIAAGILEYYT